MELRKDYILDRWVIISEKRKNRPKQFKRESETQEGICFFCPGNENLTPEEIGRVSAPKDKWEMRWFANKFPFASPDEDPRVKTDGKFFTHGGAFGYHEVIVETPDHEKQLWDLNKKNFETLLGVYKNRVEELSKKENINYVAIFKNHGPQGGTSLIHSHTQVVAFSHVPPLVREKTDASAKFSEKGLCPYCSIAEIESKSTRKCFENSEAVAFAPYASRFNYEICIMTKKHVKNFSELTKSQLADIAELIQKSLSKLREIDVSFNMFCFYAPEGSDLHFHIEIVPRVANWAGFEFLTGIIVNSVSPESAARFYRGEDY